MNPAAPDLYSADGTTEASTHNVWRMREDLWEYLTYTAEKMGSNLSPDSRIRLTTDIARVLDSLELVEGHWANPGLAAIDELRTLTLDADYAALAEAVERIKHRRRLPAPGRGTALSAGERSGTADGRPRFEVLLVDDCTPEDAASFVN